MVYLQIYRIYEISKTNSLKSFTSDGFTLGTESAINGSGNSLVSWNWKANGGTTTTNDASATSVGNIDSVYQANTTAGFSIVTWTGTGSNATIGTGIGNNAKIKFIIAKQLRLPEKRCLFCEFCEKDALPKGINCFRRMQFSSKSVQKTHVSQG